MLAPVSRCDLENVVSCTDAQPESAGIVVPSPDGFRRFHTWVTQTGGSRIWPRSMKIGAPCEPCQWLATMMMTMAFALSPNRWALRPLLPPLPTQLRLCRGWIVDTRARTGR